MLRLWQASDGAISLWPHRRLADFHRRSRSLSTPALAKKSDEETSSDLTIDTGEEEMRAIEKATRGSAQLSEGKRLTITEQPAVNRLMESLVGSRMPSEPLYDLPSWLEHSYPQFDASPKTNLFSWQVWGRQHLTKDKQRSLLAFHEYMSDDHFRRTILKRSNFELARLWEWQHKRSALGLSPDLTPEEVAKIKARRREAAALEPSSSSLPPHLDEALNLAEPSSPSPEAPPSQPESPSPLRGGILGIIHSSEVKSKKKEEKKTQGLATSHLSPEQRSILDMMRNPKEEVQELAASFISRRKRGADFMEMASRFPGGQRVKEILTHELEKRRVMDVLGVDNGSLNALEAKSHLYADVSIDQRVRGGRKAEEESVSLSPLNPSEIKKELTGSKSWMETKILNRNVSGMDLLFVHTIVHTYILLLVLFQINFLAQKSLDQSTRQMVEKDVAMAKVDRGTAGAEDLTFDLLLRPPTSTLDQVQEYLEIRYADLLHQKVQAIGLSSAQSLSLPKASTSLAPSPDAKSFNDEAQAAFDAILGPNAREAELKYIKLMSRFHDQSLLSRFDLSLCLRAAAIKAKEASEQISHEDNLLTLIAGTIQPSSSIISKLKDSDVEEAKAIWKGSISSYTSWSQRLMNLLNKDAKKSSINAEGILEWVSMPISFQEACESWDRLVRQSGVAHAPSLPHVILLDQKLRAQQPPHDPTLGLQAKDIMQACRKMYESLVLKDRKAADPSSLSWEKVIEMNARVDLKEPSSLILQPILELSGAKPPPAKLDETWPVLLKTMASIQSQENIVLPSGSPSGNTTTSLVEEGQSRPRGCVSIKQFLFLGPEPSEMQSSNTVELRVKAQGLKEEAGLSDAGIQLILDVCGEERWDGQRQEIVITCSQYSSREENKRVCLKNLMRLVDKGREEV
jgi:hypothetical protein